MFTVLSRALAVLALLFVPAAYAQQAETAHPALWVVKDEDTTIYLFGTIHVLKPGIDWLNGPVKAAFDKSDTLELEMVEPDPAAMQGVVMGMAYNPGGPGVTALLPEDKREAYLAALTGIGVPPTMLDAFDPWLPAVTIAVGSLPKLGYDPNSGVEKILTAQAKAVQKPIEGLETVEQQLGYFDSMPQDLQLKFLVSTLDQLPLLGTTLDKMVATWKAGDPDALAATMNDDLDGLPDVRRVLLTERNERWADWVAKRLETPGTVFVAVGAGHLAGPDSVQAFLARRHLEAARVE